MGKEDVGKVVKKPEPRFLLDGGEEGITNLVLIFPAIQYS